MTRGRRALIVLGIVAALFLPGAAGVGARQAHVPTPWLVHVVRPGETLWQIARAMHLGEPTGATVERLIRANHLTTPSIHPGQPLFMPGV